MRFLHVFAFALAAALQLGQAHAQAAFELSAPGGQPHARFKVEAHSTRVDCQVQPVLQQLECLLIETSRQANVVEAYRAQLLAQGWIALDASTQSASFRAPGDQPCPDKIGLRPFAPSVGGPTVPEGQSLYVIAYEQDVMCALNALGSELRSGSYRSAPRETTPQ
jgi:hypothetical protein